MVAVLFRHPNIRLLTEPGRTATAVLAVDGVIAQVGDYAELVREAPAGVRVEELPGSAVVAGFHDAHIHSGGFAREIDAVDMRGAATLDDALDRLRAHTAGHPGSDWIFGGRWDSNAWDVPVQPNRHDLDRVCPDRPVALPSVDGHTIWANTAALRRVGYDAATRDPIGGEIVRGDGGEPTGIVRESARDPFKDQMASSTSTGLIDLLERAQRRLLSYGITHITDLDGEEVREAYLAIRDRGALAVRVHKGIPLSALDKAIADGRYTGDGDRWVTTGPVKIFSDGALGSHTSHMGTEFAGEPGNHGIEVVPFDDLCAYVERAATNRIAVATHAIGDRANHLVLNAYEAARAATRAHGLRHRVEHAQHVRPEDIARFASLGVIASSQPTHCTTDMPLVGRLLAGRDLGNYPWRAFADAGATLAFGSDAPVEPANPLYGIHAAVTRQDRSGQPPGGWEPHQRVTVSEALQAYSSGAAYAAGLDENVGRIAPGQYADLVALDADPLDVDATDLHRIGVVSTVVDGQIRYTR